MGPNNNAPYLEALTAFAIAFMAGAMTAAGFIKYIERNRRETIVLRRCDRDYP